MLVLCLEWLLRVNQDMARCSSLSLARLQVASEKDLEAVMAIDKFRGVELRKLLTEVRCSSGASPDNHTLLFQAMATACIAAKYHRRWLKADLASVLLSRLHTGCPASFRWFLAGLQPAAQRLPQHPLQHHPPGLPGRAGGLQARLVLHPAMGDTPTRAALLDCLASGLVRILHGPIRAAWCWAQRAAQDSDRCHAPSLFAWTSPAACSIPSRNRTANLPHQHSDISVVHLLSIIAFPC